MDPQIEMVQKVCRYLDEGDSDAVKLADLATRTGVSVFHLQRTFMSIMGISPRQYLAARRFGNFKTAVKGREVSHDCTLRFGSFNSSSRLYENASDELDDAGDV
jgi:AraC family transcriptional regulator of adaptative response/methylated-DNA-[protein]-cysteine methyltransferase